MPHARFRVPQGLQKGGLGTVLSGTGAKGTDHVDHFQVGFDRRFVMELGGVGYVPHAISGVEPRAAVLIGRGNSTADRASVANRRPLLSPGC